VQYARVGLRLLLLIARYGSAAKGSLKTKQSRSGGHGGAKLGRGRTDIHCTDWDSVVVVRVVIAALHVVMAFFWLRVENMKAWADIKDVSLRDLL
jgi:hypothetical protein